MEPDFRPNPDDYEMPERATVEAVLVSLGDLQHRRMFFERLDNPHWVEAAAKLGVFATPPGTQVDEAGNLTYRLWPEGDYLVRMAQAVPAAVLAALQAHVETSNPYVARVVTQCAVRMPVAQARRLAPAVTEYLRQDFRHYLDPEDVVGVIVNLASGGVLEDALRVADSAYRPRPIETDASTPAWRRIDVATGLEPYWYRETLPRVIESLLPLGRRLVIRLKSWLESFQTSSRSYTEGQGDTSYVWRPSIGPHEQNQQMEEIGDALIDALRDSLSRVASTEEGVLDLVRLLYQSDQDLLRRIALHALANCDDSLIADAAISQAYEWLMSDDLLNQSFRREYSELAQRFLPRLEADRANRWVTHVLEGPPWDQPRLERIATYGRREDESVETAISRYKRVWRHTILAAVGVDALPDVARAALATLDEEDGQMEHPQFASYMTTWVGDRSPVTVEELAGWPTKQLVEYLSSWAPEERVGLGPEITREGLASTLQSAVRADAPRYAAEANEFLTADPLYVRAVLDGLREAVRQPGPAFPWENVLRLCVSAVGEGDNPGLDGTAEPHWQWVQRSVVALLDAAIGSGSDHGLPTSAQGEATSILSRLASHPDPTPEDESRLGGENMDPLTLSLNTVRPSALRALVQLAVRAASSSADATPISVPDREGPGWAISQACLSAVDTHLGPASDPSLASAAVFGELLGRLVWLDQDWLTDRLPRLLDADTAYRDVVVSTCLASYLPSSVLVETLRPWLSEWISRAAAREAIAGWRTHRPPIQLIGDHLVVLYCRTEIERQDDLVSRFFGGARVEDRAEVLGHLGWVLSKEGDVPESFSQRAMDLWDWRAALTTTGENDLDELAQFGAWVTSGRFPSDWWLPRLELAAGAPTFSVQWRLGEQLADASAQSPDQVLQIVKRLLEDRQEPYRRFELIRHVPTVIAEALDRGTPETQDDAEELLDELGRSGQLNMAEQVERRRRPEQETG